MKILYQDDHYVAVHKPSGLLVHRSPIDKLETRFAVQIVRDQIGQRVYPCHRLDKPTSGVLLFALNREALQAANELFAEHKVHKKYTALVRGWIEGEGEINHTLKGIEDAGELRGGGEPQDAVTRYKCLHQYELMESSGAYPTSRYSLVELSPLTGRTHQLRRHMKHLSHHMIGDTRYGDGRQNRFFRERFDCHRLMLQAIEMELSGHLEHDTIKIKSELDADIKRVIDRLPLRA
ncbi:MAG: pseudouridine synthase [Puniceicoccaceae bacterium]